MVPSRLIGLTLLLVMTTGAYGQDELNIRITQGMEGAQPIAIVPFGWQGSAALSAPENIAQIVADDLQRSGLFAPIPVSDLPSRPDEGTEVQFRDWRLLGTPNLVIGKVTEVGEGRYSVEFRLFDIFKAAQLTGFKFESDFLDLRRTAHEISDIIYEQLTGERGAFNTRIAYVTEVRDQTGNPRYGLSIADSDGFNPKRILESSQPIMSPAWAPSGRELAYVSFEGQQARIFIQDIATGKRREVASFPGLNGAPAWSPDGSKLAITLSKDGNPEIYILDIPTNRLRRLTKNASIDTEPAWAPDGQSLVFTSDRGGRPQVYRVPASGGKPERVTFEGNYNARASFSPDGTKLIMVYGQNGAFRIALLELQNNSVLVLTDARLDESPSFAPNGSMVLYTTTDSAGTRLAAVSTDGRARHTLGIQQGEVRESAWSPFRNK